MSFDRLEQALTLWESLSDIFGSEVLALQALGRRCALPYGGCLHNWREFRQHVVADPEFDYEKFGWTREDAYFHSGIQEDVFHWAKTSRRLFSLSGDLQRMLMLTGLEGVQWNNVKFPLNAMYVSLPVPLVDTDGISYDAMLVVTLERSVGHDFRIVLFSDGLQGVGETTADIRRVIARRMSSKKYDQALAAVQRFKKKLNKLSTRYAQVLSFTAEQSGQEVLDSVDLSIARTRRNASRAPWYKNYTNDQLEVFLEGKRLLMLNAVQIAVGLSLYMRNMQLSSRNVYLVKALGPRQRGPKRAIDHASELFHFEVTQKLMPTERKMIDALADTRVQGVGMELNAHVRRGHYRWPPGSSGNHDIPKDVWVRPTFVRRDRLTDSELPVATSQAIE